MASKPRSKNKIAYVRLQRYDTPGKQTYAAVRPADLAAVLAGSDNVETVQQCDLDLPPEITAGSPLELAAPLRPVMPHIGTVAGDTWVTGPLKGQPRPGPWGPARRAAACHRVTGALTSPRTAAAATCSAKPCASARRISPESGGAKTAARTTTTRTRAGPDDEPAGARRDPAYGTAAWRRPGWPA